VDDRCVVLVITALRLEESVPRIDVFFWFFFLASQLRFSIVRIKGCSLRDLFLTALNALFR
jgi:hypothetical protein